MNTDAKDLCYTVLDHDSKARKRIRCPGCWVPDRFGAETCAHHYFQNHGGEKLKWPLRFVIFDLDGKECGPFKVERDPTPDFLASEVKEK